MNNLIKLLFVLAFIIPKSENSNAQSPPAYIADSLQAILDNALPSDFSNPGGVLGVVVPGEWSWFGASGNAIAGITAGHPLTIAQPNTRFRAGSVTKSLVATCILKLEQDGILSIDDPIETYLRASLFNDTIAPSNTITIKQLLNHTSGVANAADNVSCQLDILSDLLASHSLEEAIWCGASQGELFPPGSSWEYSNTNYSILAMIIENVSGMSYSNYLNQTIVTPLSLINTEIPSTDEISGDHMGCYWFMGSDWFDMTIIDPTVYTGWADVVSNTSDLLTYHQALLSGSIINSTQLDKMKNIDAMADNYGLGMEFNSVDFTSYYGHYGEVANTNGMFFCELTSDLAPNGYYFVYNFNTQGVPMITEVDRPIYHLLKGDLGLADKDDTHLSVYPNPTTHSCTVEFPYCVTNATISLRDLSGRMILSENLLPGTTQTELDLHKIFKGVYYLELENNGKRYLERLIVH